MPLTLRAQGSHLHPGARGTVDGNWSGRPAAKQVVIEFADGSVALGQMSPEAGGQQVLDVDPYATARGTAIAAKRWTVTVTEGRGEQALFRVLTRDPDQP